MKAGWRSLACGALVAALSLCAFSAVTHGFTAVTSDGVRRAELTSAPRELPELELMDARGKTLSLRDYAVPGKQTTFVNLVYVRCNSICVTSAGSHSWLQAEIMARGLQGRVRLLTLSFDPSNDTPAVLSGYAGHIAADPTLWRVATPRDAGQLQRMLDLFAVVVLPDGQGGYSHNAALFVIGEEGLLAGAYDVERPDVALADYLQRRTGS